MNPYVSDDSSGSGMDQSTQQFDKESISQLRDLEIALGKIPSHLQDGGKKYRYYQYIYHPLSYQPFSIYSKNGKKILFNFLKK